MLERIKTTDTRYPFPTTPNGWFCVALSHELSVGQVKPLKYFEQELVLFRTEDGQARVFDAYCPHLGAHFGYGGKVVGQNIECPYHRWAFDGTGTCVKAPAVDKIPPAARTKPWPVHETDGVIFVFYHAEQAPPDWLPTTRMGPGWLPLQTFPWKATHHIQETIENMVDVLHAQFTHGYADIIKMSEPKVEGPHWKHTWDMLLLGEYTETQASATEYEYGGDVVLAGGPKVTPDKALPIKADITLCGLGIIDIMTSLDVLGGWPTMLRFCLTPIDEDHAEILLMTSVRPPDGTDPAFAEQANKYILSITARDAKQDYYIFQHKAYRRRPALCSLDHGVMPLRRWAKQFYSMPGDLDGQPAE